MNDNQFATLGLKESIVKAISDLGFTKPSQIQEQSIPVTLSGANEQTNMNGVTISGGSLSGG